MSSYRSNILSTWAQWRSRRSVQITLMCVLSALVGFTLQITKLAALDSSGRQYGQGSYSGKVCRLVSATGKGPGRPCCVHRVSGGGGRSYYNERGGPS